MILFWWDSFISRPYVVHGKQLTERQSDCRRKPARSSLVSHFRHWKYHPPRV